MSMRKLMLLLSAPLVLGACTTQVVPGAAAQRYGIGTVASAELVRGWDIDVSPDGSGLPAGSGSVAEGRKLFAEKCVACHGPNGSGGPAGRLTGGTGSLATTTPVRTVSSYWPYAPGLFDYVRRAMPWDKPMSLTPNEVYALTAFVLSVDGIVPETAVMDAKALPQVKMPNRGGFINSAEAPEVKTVRCMADCDR